MTACCNHNCEEGRACPVRLQNAKIFARLQREVTEQLAADQQRAGELTTGHGGARVTSGVSAPLHRAAGRWTAFFRIAAYWAMATAFSAVVVGGVSYLHARWLGA